MNNQKNKIISIFIAMIVFVGVTTNARFSFAHEDNVSEIQEKAEERAREDAKNSRGQTKKYAEEAAERDAMRYEEYEEDDEREEEDDDDKYEHQGPRTATEAWRQAVEEENLFKDSDGDGILDQFDTHPGEDDFAYVIKDRNRNGIADDLEVLL